MKRVTALMLAVMLLLTLSNCGRKAQDSLIIHQGVPAPYDLGANDRGCLPQYPGCIKWVSVQYYRHDYSKDVPVFSEDELLV